MEIEELRLKIMDVLEYDPETGLFRWKVKINARCKTGWFAGDKNSRYKRIRVFNNIYLAHRLAWLIYHGHWPCNEIDHEDHDKHNNRIGNLRDVQHSQNQMNQGMNPNNTSGFRGVSFYKSEMKWCSRLQLNGKTIHLGKFSNKDDAIAARQEANVKYGFHPNHGRQNNEEKQDSNSSRK